MLNNFPKSIIFILFSILMLLFILSFIYNEEVIQNKTPFKDLELFVSHDKKSIKFFYKKEKQLLADIYIDGKYLKSIKTNNGIFKVFIKESDESKPITEVRLKNKNKVIGSIQFARENKTFLMRKYNYTSNYGYIIIEKNTFPFIMSKKEFSINENMYSSITLKDKSNIKKMFSKFKIQKETMNKSLYREIEELNDLTEFIWSHFSKTGPSNFDFSKESLIDTLKVLKIKKGKLQCTGTRDLFIRLSNVLDYKLNIRKVETFRYSPFINNIVVNGHSLLEIKINNKWVLYDPFVRVYFISNGKLLSVEDIKKNLISKTLKIIIPMHIIVKKHKIRSDFELEKNNYSPFHWNYFTHFNYIKYKNIYFRR